MKVISYEVFAEANAEDRTFDITKVYKDGYEIKYRTLPMNDIEFVMCEFDTSSDWDWFLKNCKDEYYILD